MESEFVCIVGASDYLLLQFFITCYSTEYIQPICLAGQFEDPDPSELGEVVITGYNVIDCEFQHACHHESLCFLVYDTKFLMNCS